MPKPYLTVRRHPSPLVYAGGKVWFVDDFLTWADRFPRPKLLVEPFAGGATIGLVMLLSGRAERLLISDINADVAAFWRVVVSDEGERLAERVEETILSDGKLRLQRQIRRAAEPVEYALSVLINNRTAYGGNMHTGGVVTSVDKNWNKRRDEISRRIRDIWAERHRITFQERSALDVLADVADDPTAMTFVDPPYIFSMGRPADVLYKHVEFSPEDLFARLDALQHPWLLTSDCGHKLYVLARQHNMKVDRLAMHNIDNKPVPEGIVTREGLK